MNKENCYPAVALITGAAGGFGQLLAEKLAERGTHLVLSDRDGDGLHALASRLIERDIQVFAQACDVTREGEVAALVLAAVERFQRLDMAINNAGTSSPMKALIDTTEADLDLNFAVNAKGVFFGMKYQIRQMLTQPSGGIILNVASMAGLSGAPKLTAYGAAKHAVVGITKTAALEYARNNIRVNAICPYFSPTPLVTNGIDESLQEALARGSPMKRLGRPEEMVAAMLMLLDPDNSYLTGQAIAVDGGISAL